MRHVEEIVQVLRDPRLAAAVRAQDGHQHECLWCRLYRCPCEDTFRPQELEGLDLHGLGSLVEVLGQDNVGYLAVRRPWCLGRQGRNGWLAKPARRMGEGDMAGGKVAVVGGS